ncbi:Serine palmitoyltransferase 1 [Pseudolycoriella hygida]|uniref:Serine palmitoyltransferase 1 n=1 Tax=Pseudolycoriella hygida TaxID=35572 RepID=A0A9Q0S9S7_9DIPT|nr:Serine palmitoyltransferase 1 [Pseudolycoriella hygida]
MISASHVFDELYNIFWKAPLYTICLEVALVISVIWLVFYRKKERNESKLTPEQKAELLEKWTPEPLIEDLPVASVPSPRVVSGRAGKRVTVDGHDCLNMATHNYLGLLEDKAIEESAIKCLRKYGVGSCGPRGFYGTSDVHLELEQRLAKFMQAESAVLYSYGFSTIASAIPAYSKQGDIVFVDECVNFAIQKGLDASRSKIVYFKHNDMNDLDRLLAEQQIADIKNPKKAGKSRRFLIAEGIYMNTGDICPLEKLVELRKKYKLRMFLDESISFGTLGKHGRGLTEHLNVDV